MIKVRDFFTKNATIAAFVWAWLALWGATLAQKEYSRYQVERILAGKLEWVVKPTQELLTPETYVPFSQEGDVFSRVYRKTGDLIIGEQTPIQTILAGKVDTTLKIEGPEHKHAEHFKVDETNMVTEKELNNFLGQLDNYIKANNIKISSMEITAKSDPTGLNEASLKWNDSISLELNRQLAMARTENIIERVKIKRPELKNLLSALPPVVSRMNDTDILKLQDIGRRYNLNNPSEVLRSYKDNNVKLADIDASFVKTLLDKSISVNISWNKFFEIGLSDPNMIVILFLVFILMYWASIWGSIFTKYDSTEK